jgi:hypothetical protein
MEVLNPMKARATKLVVPLLLGGAAAPAALAQEPPDELEAAAGVETVEILPAAPLGVALGDTLKIRLRFLDAEGDPVDGFRWGFQFSPAIAGARPDRSAGPGSFEIWGMKPGRTSLQVGVLLAVLGYALGTYAAWICGNLMRIVAPEKGSHFSP